jgi:2-iminobutanoate/2-iminopropanoate deaminase
MDDVLRVSCYLADIEDFPRFNAVYAKYFTDSPPARSTFQAARLPLDVQVEMDAIVALPEKKN